MRRLNQKKSNTCQMQAQTETCSKMQVRRVGSQAGMVNTPPQTQGSYDQDFGYIVKYVISLGTRQVLHLPFREQWVTLKLGHSFAATCCVLPQNRQYSG